MKITRIVADEAGESRFVDEVIELFEAGEIGRLSEERQVSGIVFRTNDASYDYDWHTAPRKQYIVLLDGEIEIEVSTGEKRRFTGGEVLLVEDTTGKGHRTRAVDGKSRRSLFLPVPARDHPSE